jgi:heme oxygenase
MTLALDLKEGTKVSHSAAENTKFVSSFLKGVVSRDNYKQLTANFYYVYRAMEEEIDKLDDFPLHDKLLNRTHKLEQDLRYYYGVMWRDKIQPSQSTKNYVKRIQVIAQQTPYLLVAHHYTRYMGDLSGGQILASITKKALNLTTEGLKFYEFDIPNTKEYKDKYRQTLNDLNMSEVQTSMLIDEANYAFKLNMLLFDELQGNPIKSIVKVLFSYIRERFKR